MLSALGAVLAWLVLRQWPQALLAAVLIPCWLMGEWTSATDPVGHQTRFAMDATDLPLNTLPTR
jgi:hypothetical protein